MVLTKFRNNVVYFDCYINISYTLGIGPCLLEKLVAALVCSCDHFQN
jgi:hypothetical protein